MMGREQLTYKKCVQAQFLKESNITLQVVQTILDEGVCSTCIFAVQSVYDTTDQELCSMAVSTVEQLYLTQYN